jgi:NADH-quinone oxidoreductase subunit E
MTPESATRLVDDLQSGTEVKSPRGATVCTWKEAERVLAGFPDGRADEGPTGGKATLAGLRLARERSWTAPPASQGGAPPPLGGAPGPRPEDQPGRESGTGSQAIPDTRKED